MFEAYPLQWPTGRPRTEQWNREDANFSVTLGRARDNVVREVTLLCGVCATTVPIPPDCNLTKK